MPLGPQSRRSRCFSSKSTLTAICPLLSHSTARRRIGKECGDHQWLDPGESGYRHLSPALGAQWTFAFCKLLYLKDWSGRMDLNHRPPGPEEGGRKHLSAASGVAYRTARPFTLLLKWTEVGRKRFATEW